MFEIVKEAVQSLLTRKSFQKRVGRLLSHPITLLAIATVFATIAGVWLTNYYQERSWVREKQFEAFRHGFEEGLHVIDGLSEVMSRRFFGLNRVVWAAKGTGTGALDEVWEEYYESVVEWNTKIMSYRGRLARSVGPDMAQALGSWDDPYATNPQTIHGQFYQAHELVRALVDCVREKCSGEAKENALKEAQQAVNALGVAIEAFIQGCTEHLYAQVRSS